MSRKLENRIALVTGASRGIGRSIAVALAGAGAHVAVNYRTQQSAAEEVCATIRKLGSRAIALQADVSVSADVNRLATAVERDLGPVDILVNNAGISQIKPFGELTEADWDHLLDVNLKSAFLVTQRVLPGMRQRRWGRIINLSSVAAQTGGVIGPHYAASKAGLVGLTHSYAALLAKEGITANAIAPALIADGHGYLQSQCFHGTPARGFLRLAGGDCARGCLAGGKRLHHRPDHQREWRLVHDVIARHLRYNRGLSEAAHRKPIWRIPGNAHLRIHLRRLQRAL